MTPRNILLTFFAILLAVTTWAPRAHAQRSADPLNEDEVDQIRELRDNPNERIKLYMKFIDERISDIKQLSSEPNVNNRPAQLRGKLEEFTRLADELQDNLDTFDAAHADIRKALKDLVPDTAKWPDVLNKPVPEASYDFARKTALECAQSTIDQTKKMMEDQEKYFADHKDERGKNGTGPS
jgi:hypothetical protein